MSLSVSFEKPRAEVGVAKFEKTQRSRCLVEPQDAAHIGQLPPSDRLKLQTDELWVLSFLWRSKQCWLRNASEKKAAASGA
jgi:hypothetical protein